MPGAEIVEADIELTEMAKVFDDLATKFVSFSDALEAQFGDLSIDFSLATGNNKALKGGSKWAADAAGDARALSAAAEEREAAKKRGEEILLQLSPGYFDSAFDALKHELCQMGPDARQDDIDVVVDRLTAAMEVVSCSSRPPASHSSLSRAVPCSSCMCASRHLPEVPLHCAGGGHAAGQARAEEPRQADCRHHNRDAC